MQYSHGPCTDFIRNHEGPQQARNVDAEKRAASIRIRAEMKGAQLYRESEKAKAIDKGDKRTGKGGKVMRSPRDTASAPAPKTLEQLGISKKQSSNWQKLADNSKAVEKYLRESLSFKAQRTKSDDN